MNIFKLLAAAIAVVAAGCQANGMRDQTIAYNEAIANSTNQFFLLNVLRARDRYPIYYTRNTGDSAARSATPGLTLALDAAQNFTPSLTASATGGHTVSLVNLDDQKSMRGALTPVPLSVLDGYLGQGWPREVLLMMFIKRIEIDKKLAGELVWQFKWRCGRDANTRPPDYEVDPRATELAYCADTLPVNPPQVSPVDTLETGCLNGNQEQGKPVQYPAPNVPGDNYVFDNYPPDPKQLECFQAMLRVLIGLGLAPSSGAKYSLIAPSLPDSSVSNLKGLGDAITAKLSISQRENGRYAACTKSDLSGFTLDPALTGDDDLCTQVRTAESRYAARRVQSDQRTLLDSAITAGFQDALREVVASEPVNVTSTKSVSILGPALPKSCAEQAEHDTVCVPKRKAFCKVHKDDSLCKEPTFQFTTRSLDSMIYYLGESLRAKPGDATDPCQGLSIWVHGSDPTRLRCVKLFEATNAGVSQGGLVNVNYRGDNWTIPACPDSQVPDGCPHSPQVLSLLNQIWGLQKEAAEAPTVPVVSVINAH